MAADVVVAMLVFPRVRGVSLSLVVLNLAVAPSSLEFTQVARYQVRRSVLAEYPRSAAEFLWKTNSALEPARSEVLRWLQN